MTRHWATTSLTLPERSAPKRVRPLGDQVASERDREALACHIDGPDDVSTLRFGRHKEPLA